MTRKEIQSRYRTKHKDDIKRYEAAYRKNNPEKRKKACRNWYLRNKNRHAAYNKRWRKENPERTLEMQREYRRAHPEKSPEALRRWRRRHPEKYRAYRAVQSHRRRTAHGSFTTKQWIQLKNKFGNKCLCCKLAELQLKCLKQRLTIDHVIPISKGGTNTIKNIQPLCGPCNSKKHDKIIDFRRAA